LLTLTVLPFVGCGSGTSQTPQPQAARAAHRRHHHRRRRRQRAISSPIASRLVFSSASAMVIQHQPAPGTCHARGAGLHSQPDPACTPGALNPAVTQANIDRTICVRGWSEGVRPSESVTEPEKTASMLAYGDSGSPSEYEYDHLVSLELGGAVNDPRNLWPEPGASPNPKDAVEDALHRMVCDGQIRLSQAQRIIATEWVRWAAEHDTRTTTPPPPARPTAPAATSSSPGKPVADVNCSDFSTHAAAERWFDQHGGSPGNDVAGLDADHDGLACESLP
jgi:hypothetical protein